MTSAYWELSNYIERADLSSWTTHCDFCCLFGLSPCMINRHFKYNIPLLCVVLCSAAQLLPTPCKPMDCSPWGFFVHGIFQARILEWVAISYARGSSRPRDQTHISCISCKPTSHASPALAGSLLTTVPPVKHIFFLGGAHILCYWSFLPVPPVPHEIFFNLVYGNSISPISFTPNLPNYLLFAHPIYSPSIYHISWTISYSSIAITWSKASDPSLWLFW